MIKRLVCIALCIAMTFSIVGCKKEKKENFDVNSYLEEFTIANIETKEPETTKAEKKEKNKRDKKSIESANYYNEEFDIAFKCPEGFTMGVQPGMERVEVGDDSMYKMMASHSNGSNVSVIATRSIGNRDMNDYAKSYAKQLETALELAGGDCYGEVVGEVEFAGKTAILCRIFVSQLGINLVYESYLYKKNTTILAINLGGFGLHDSLMEAMREAFY